MSKKTFTKEEIDKLRKNKYVKKVSEKGITYTDEFKKIFINESDKGGIAREIFEKYGFEVDILGNKRIDSSGSRWKKAYRDKGVLGLVDTRKESSGRPRTKDLTMEEKLERLEVKVEWLKIENEFLKKLKMIERQMMKKEKKNQKQ